MENKLNVNAAIHWHPFRLVSNPKGHRSR